MLLSWKQSLVIGGVGWVVGTDVGCADGTSVGLEVGTDVGCTVGTSVGLEVGLKVGCVVALPLGCEVGFEVVGCTVDAVSRNQTN